jgi:hypothetical protein
MNATHDMSDIPPIYGKTRSTEIRWEDSPCDLCGSRSVKPMFSTKDYRFLTDDTVFNVVKCRNCGLVRINPRPVEDDIHRYYHGEFYREGETPDEALAAIQFRLDAMASRPRH